MEVSLVIPGKNASSTIEKCLDSVVHLIGKGLKEIIFVNDGSTDDTEEIVKRYPVRCLKGPGKGPSLARNIGWRASTTPLIWFIDADCVAEENALSTLLEHMKDPKVAGVGGSYGNMFPNSLLACLIHEEIIDRHLKMPRDVNFLGTFNVLYRKEFLEKVDGLDESLVMAEDADLAFRIRESGGKLEFDIRSRVKHHHPTNLKHYLITQKKHGYWRTKLYAKHPHKMSGDSYSGISDHVQPPLAMLSLVMAPSLLLGPLGFLAQTPLLLGLAASQSKLTTSIVKRTGKAKYLSFAPMGILRSYARSIGLAKGALENLRQIK